MTEQNTFNINTSDDYIFGSSQNDLIDGLDGNDTLNGGNGNDTLNGGNGNDSLNGSNGNDILNGGDGEDILNGSNGNDILNGGDGNDTLNGSNGNDILEGGQDSDTLNGSTGADIFAYAGDPFEGQDVSAPERQIISDNQDFITDFDFTRLGAAEDKYRFNATDFGVVGDVNFTAVDANAEGAAIAPGTNVVAVLNSNDADNPDDPFLAGTAANQIAELTSEDGAGFFAYFNSELGLNRVVYSTNLNDASADLNVISQQTDLTGARAIRALNDFSADNFEFEDIQLADNNQDTDAEGLNPILGDAGNNELVGTEGNDLLFGDFGGDTITGGAGADVFAYAGDPFEGRDVSAPERQIIADNQDFITDFDFAEDTYRFNATDFDVDGDVNFAAVDANAEDASIAPGTNVVAVLNSNDAEDPDAPFAAGTAANQIAELTTEDGAGFFSYFNSGLQLNRLVYSTNLNDASADLNVISQQTDLTGQDAIDALSNFSADNFEFEDIQLADNNQDTDAGDLNPILGDAGNNELVGTEGNDLIDGGGGNDTLFGETGEDVFLFSDNYFEGIERDVDEQDFSSEQADIVGDFNISEDRIALNPSQFPLDEIRFANQAAGDSIEGANVIVLESINSNEFSAIRAGGGDTSSGLAISFSDFNDSVNLIQYSGIDGNRQGSGGLVAELENLSADDLAIFTADNFALDNFSEVSFM